MPGATFVPAGCGAMDLEAILLAFPGAGGIPYVIFSMGTRYVGGRSTVARPLFWS